MNNHHVQPTAFAPAERTAPTELRQAADMLANSPLLRTLYEALEIPILILNPQRQLLFVNRRLLALLGQDNLQCILGLRPGEALGCTHASETKGGCGTTEACSLCGAVNAILQSQASREKVIRECRILRRLDNSALDLQISASPLNMGNRDYTILVVEDISDKKRRRILERIFFHDISNTAVGVRALSELLPAVPSHEVPAVGQMINVGAHSMVREIDSQRELTAIENNELVPKFAPTRVAELFRTLASIYQHHDVAKGKHLAIRSVEPGRSINTDATLLGRVLQNMTKNALEASAAGESVTVGFEALDGQRARFSVHNPAVMPREVQLQIFQRSFSTKGEGRGLGTYSIKLITERYLKGKAGFTSAPGQGTVFYADVPLG